MGSEARGRGHPMLALREFTDPLALAGGIATREAVDIQWNNELGDSLLSGRRSPLDIKARTIKIQE